MRTRRGADHQPLREARNTEFTCRSPILRLRSTRLRSSLVHSTFSPASNSIKPHLKGTDLRDCKKLREKKRDENIILCTGTELQAKQSFSFPLLLHLDDAPEPSLTVHHGIVSLLNLFELVSLAHAFDSLGLSERDSLF